MSVGSHPMVRDSPPVGKQPLPLQVILEQGGELSLFFLSFSWLLPPQGQVCPRMLSQVLCMGQQPLEFTPQV
jgi:hypothetical protein